MGNNNKKGNRKADGRRPNAAASRNDGRDRQGRDDSRAAERQNKPTARRDNRDRREAETEQPKLSFWARLFGGGKKKSDSSIDQTTMDAYRASAQEIIQKMEPDSDLGKLSAADLMGLLLDKLNSAYETAPAQPAAETIIAQPTAEATVTAVSEVPVDMVTRSDYDALSAQLQKLDADLQEANLVHNSEKAQWEAEKKDLEAKIQGFKEATEATVATEATQATEATEATPATQADQSAELNGLKSELKSVKDQLADANQKNKNIEEQSKIDKAELSRIPTLETEVKKTEDARAQIETERNQLRGEIDGVKKNLDTAITERDKARTDLQSAQTELDQTKQEVSKLKGEIEKLNTEIGALKDSDTGKLQAKIGTLNSEKDSLNQSIEDLKQAHGKEIEAKQAEIDEKQKQIDELNGTVSKKEGTIAELNGKINEINATVAGLNEKVAEKKQEIEGKNSEISDLNKAAKLQKKAYDDLAAEKKDLDDRISKQETSINEKEKTIASKDAEIKELNSKVDGLNASVKNLEDTVAGKEKEIEKGIETIAAKDEELKASAAEISKSLEEAAKRVNGCADQVMKLLDEGGYEIGFGEMADTCEEDEATTRKYFGRVAKGISDIDVKPMRNTSEYMEAVSKVIEADLEQGMEGIILPLARTCAYARLPFMRDDRGEDNMRLDGAKLTRIASGLNSLLAQVGIELIVPVPFADKIDEGDYEDGQGNVPNLDYICPNSRSHLDGVDREDISDVVTDIISVGYRKGDKTVKAVVLK